MLSCTSSLLCCSARTGFVVTSGWASLGHIPPFPYCIALHGGPMIPQGNITRHMIFQRCSSYVLYDFHAPITSFFLNGTGERAIYSGKDDTSQCSISSADVPPSLYNFAFHPHLQIRASVLHTRGLLLPRPCSCHSTRSSSRNGSHTTCFPYGPSSLSICSRVDIYMERVRTCSGWVV